jgi:hypothetical protein
MIPVSYAPAGTACALALINKLSKQRLKRNRLPREEVLADVAPARSADGEDAEFELRLRTVDLDVPAELPVIVADLGLREVATDGTLGLGHAQMTEKLGNF